MKKLLCLVAAIVAASSFTAHADGINNYYPQTFIVDDLDYENDLIILVDFNGNVFEYEGIEDYEPGDVAAAIMYNNGTTFINDDQIIDLKYCGYIY